MNPAELIPMFSGSVLVGALVGWQLARIITKRRKEAAR